MFKQIQNKLIHNNNNQKGQALIIALVLLALVSLILPPLLNLASSALLQGTMIENRTKRIYAADAGVESAWLNISNGALNLPSDVNDQWTYFVDNLASDTTVNVTITLLSQSENSNKYTVNSISNFRNNSNTIDATITTQKGDYSYFMDNLLTTEGDLYFKNKVTVNGPIQGAYLSLKDPEPGDGYVENVPDPAIVWPSESELQSHYSDLDTLPDGTTISSDLTSDIHVTGTCDIESINLNGHTVFADSIINVAGGLTGEGCLVAIGNIEISNHLDTGEPGSGIFLVSLGRINFDPGANFYGWAAGKEGLTLKNGGGSSCTILPFNYDLNFPGLGGSGGPGVKAGTTIISTWKEN
jgi:hypothetical protein